MLALCRHALCDDAKFDSLSCCVARFLARIAVGHAVFSLDHVVNHDLLPLTMFKRKAENEIS